MKYAIWMLGAFFLIFTAGCNVLNPTANQVTIETSFNDANACNVIVNLDGNNTVTMVNNQAAYEFPLVGPGSHTLNFSTSNSVTCNGINGVSCLYSQTNAVTYSTTFNTNAGTIYVAAVSQGGSCNDLVVTIQ